MKVVSRYLLTSLVRGYGVMFVVVGALLWVISLLELLGGSDGSSSAIELVLRSLIAIPVDLIDLLPVVAILATATVLSTMQAQREIVVLRVSGVSLLTIVRLALVPGIMIALTALVALQFLAPVLYRAPDQAAVGELAENSLWHPWHGLWVRSENKFMNVGAFELGELPGEIAIYEFDADGKLERQIRAARAIPAVGRWMLEDVVIKRVDGGPERITEHRQWAWPSFLSERQLELFRRAPASLPLTDLWTYIQSLKMRDQDASDFELVFWRRLALPLACIGMVLIAAAISARPMKRGALSVKVTLAVGIGLGYHLLAGMAGFFGLVADLSPPLVALGPPVLLAGFSAWLLATSR